MTYLLKGITIPLFSYKNYSYLYIVWVVKSNYCSGECSQSVHILPSPSFSLVLCIELCCAESSYWNGTQFRYFEPQPTNLTNNCGHILSFPHFCAPLYEIAYTLKWVKHCLMWNDSLNSVLLRWKKN